MNENFSIQSPFIFNCWKHHLQFLKKSARLPIEEIKKGIVHLGESQMDLYTGTLTLKNICDEIEVQLERVIKINLLNYLQWLQADGKSYKAITLSDGSQWTLRFGEDPINYIHIHPCRQSANTIRVKSYALKTALIITSLNSDKQINTEFINLIRKEYLSLAPVKSVKEDAAVLKLVELLQ
ncbi:MAG: hypothetical protein K8H86_07465 [Ignavibacteriaceae bacterium]|nr:hypothetical protein [Ignavibacteriaceae bacterium]